MPIFKQKKSAIKYFRAFPDEYQGFSDLPFNNSRSDKVAPAARNVSRCGRNENRNVRNAFI
jgi:hypothetical protein